MAGSYLPYRPEQDFLLPHSMHEWLPEGHLAYFINDTADSRDLAAFHARYAKGGPRNQPFHLAMMVKGADLWLRYRRVQVAQAGQEAA